MQSQRWLSGSLLCLYIKVFLFGTLVRHTFGDTKVSNEGSEHMSMILLPLLGVESELYRGQKWCEGIIQWERSQWRRRPRWVLILQPAGSWSGQRRHRLRHTLSINLVINSRRSYHDRRAGQEVSWSLCVLLAFHRLHPESDIGKRICLHRTLSIRVQALTVWDRSRGRLLILTCWSLVRQVWSSLAQLTKVPHNQPHKHDLTNGMSLTKNSHQWFMILSQ